MFWDIVWDKMVWMGLPAVCYYHMFCENVFLNTSDTHSVGMEKVGNVLLTPAQYVFNGKEITREGDQFRIESHFDYTHDFTLKMGTSILAAPLSLVCGSIVKGMAYFSKDVREKHDAFVAWSIANPKNSNLAYYKKLGMPIDDIAEPIQRHFHERRPGDENHFAKEKEGLKEIVRILNENQIVFWLDCGTCLGAYRYGGIIPWDFDMDLAILQDDFDNAERALRHLDSKRYRVQDWSGRDRPKSYLKIYDRETRALTDIYVFKINPKERCIRVILSNENSIFLTENWKKRERRYVVDTPFDMVFPLRKAMFDGIEVYVPNQTETYLKMRYGENLGPAKVYDPKTNQYEKDLSHPYWLFPNAK